MRKQDVNLARLNYRRYFTFAECRVDHCLAAAISARSIIGCAGFSRSATRCAALVRNARATYRATNPRDLPFLSDRSNDMTALFAASDAHLFDSISDRKNLFLFHTTPSLGGLRFFEKLRLANPISASA